MNQWNAIRKNHYIAHGQIFEHGSSTVVTAPFLEMSSPVKSTDAKVIQAVIENAKPGARKRKISPLAHLSIEGKVWRIEGGVGSFYTDHAATSSWPNRKPLVARAGGDPFFNKFTDRLWALLKADPLIRSLWETAQKAEESPKTPKTPKTPKSQKKGKDGKSSGKMSKDDKEAREEKERLEKIAAQERLAMENRLKPQLLDYISFMLGREKEYLAGDAMKDVDVTEQHGIVALKHIKAALAEIELPYDVRTDISMTADIAVKEYFQPRAVKSKRKSLIVADVPPPVEFGPIRLDYTLPDSGGVDTYGIANQAVAAATQKVAAAGEFLPRLAEKLTPDTVVVTRLEVSGASGHLKRRKKPSRRPMRMPSPRSSRGSSWPRTGSRLVECEGNSV
jgi:hypothetical protein